MKLADWLKMSGTKLKDFARDIGVQPSVITDYCEGRYCPRPVRARRIFRRTGGQVTPNDFAELPEAAE